MQADLLDSDEELDQFLADVRVSRAALAGGIRYGPLDAARDLCEIGLVEGTPDDVRQFINGADLVRLGDQTHLPPRVRSAWQPLIDAARAAGLAAVPTSRERSST